MQRQRTDPGGLTSVFASSERAAVTRDRGVRQEPDVEFRRDVNYECREFGRDVRLECDVSLG